MTREEAGKIMEHHVEKARRENIPLFMEKMEFVREDELFFYFSHAGERCFGVHKPTGGVLPLPR